MIEDRELVTKAQSGDREALGALVAQSRDLVYNLALRMLADPAEAEDVTQEILMRVVTNLGSFRGESAFRTWVYRVASNQLLTFRKQRAAHRIESFDALEGYLDGGIAADEPAIEDQVLVNEARMRCTTTMLSCLDRDHRLAFILGEILELTSEEGAEVLDVSSDVYRKRLSRARERMTEFMTRRCGIVNEALPCRCNKQAAHAVKQGRLKREELAWGSLRTKRALPVMQPASTAPGAVERVQSVFRSYPEFEAPDSVVERLNRFIAA